VLLDVSLPVTSIADVLQSKSWISALSQWLLRRGILSFAVVSSGEWQLEVPGALLPLRQPLSPPDLGHVQLVSHSWVAVVAAVLAGCAVLVGAAFLVTKPSCGAGVRLVVASVVSVGILAVVPVHAIAGFASLTVALGTLSAMRLGTCSACTVRK